MSPEWIPLLFAAAVIVLLLLMMRPRAQSRRVTICRIVVMEAMASGLPVIISNEVNIHGDIAKAKAGLVVSPESDELYNAILKLLETPQLRIEMGQRARRFVELNHSPSSTAREMTRVYRDIIQGSYESPAWRMSPKSV